MKLDTPYSISEGLFKEVYKDTNNNTILIPHNTQPDDLLNEILKRINNWGKAIKLLEGAGNNIYYNSRSQEDTEFGYEIQQFVQQNK